MVALIFLNSLAHGKYAYIYIYYRRSDCAHNRSKVVRLDLPGSSPPRSCTRVMFPVRDVAATSLGEGTVGAERATRFEVKVSTILSPCASRRDFHFSPLAGTGKAERNGREKGI